MIRAREACIGVRDETRRVASRLNHLKATIFLVIAYLVASSAALAGDLDRVIVFNIEAQTLGEALLQFGAQADVKISFAWDPKTARLGTQELKGSYTARQALSKILRGTPLGFEEHGNTVEIVVARLATRQPKLEASPGTPADDPPASASGNAKQRKSATAGTTLEEVVVVGTHIRGLSGPTGEKPVVITRQQIETSGYATTPQIIESLPQNFGGGVGEVQSPISTDTTAANFNRGTAVNLRGLGADSTLVLIDGHRVPGSGVNGAFTDISDIPASAIERIEVLPDGASAVYGSDAVGGVVNIVLRQKLNGAETTARVGTYAGAATETTVSQVIGHIWSAGSVLADYQYYHRDSLPATARRFSSSDDLRGYGGSDYRSPDSNPGNILSLFTGLPAFAIPAHQDGVGLTPADLLAGQVNYFDSAPTRDLLPEQTMHSAFVSFRQTVADRVELFSESRFNLRETLERAGPLKETLTVPSTNPFFVNPLAGINFVELDYNFLQDLGTQMLDGRITTYTEVAGLKLSLPEQWQLSISGNYGRERTRASLNNEASTGALAAALADPNPATAFNPFGDGSYTSPATLAAIRATDYENDHSYVNEEALTADGPLWRLPGGPVRVAAGAQYRAEGVSGTEEFPGADSSKNLARNVLAGFMELAMPVVGPRNAVTGVRSLRLSLAGRIDRYSDFGRTANSKAGVDWSPTRAWHIRGTWGTSFKPPRLIQLLTSFPNAFDFATSLEAPTGLVSSLVQFGNNPALRPETAHVWTTGMDFSPAGGEGPSLDATYWNIDFENVIEAAGPAANPYGILMDESAWASVINLAPTSAEIAAICHSPTFFGSVAGCLGGKYGAIVDLRLQNLASERVRGFDLSGSYPWSGVGGEFRIGVQSTYVVDYLLQASQTSPTEQLVNTIGNVPRLRLRGSLAWSRGGLSATAYANVTGGYTDNISVPERHVGSWETVDLSVAYRVPWTRGILNSASVRLSAVNLFNEDPPFANVGSTAVGGFGYDPANANPYGRILSLQISTSY
jgi:iron complex outermembrane receptor protein